MTRAHWGVTALLAVIVGWFVFDGVSSLIGLPALYEQLSSQLGLESAPVPWVALWAGVVLPVVFFVVAVVIARRESITRFTLVLIAALAATAAVRLSLIATATGSIIFVN